MRQTIWQNWNQSGKFYCGNAQYLNHKNSPYGDQDLFVNVWVVQCIDVTVEWRSTKCFSYIRFYLILDFTIFEWTFLFLVVYFNLIRTTSPFCGVWTNGKCAAWRRKWIFHLEAICDISIASCTWCPLDRLLVGAILFL
jgi:hypothetical protein